MLGPQASCAHTVAVGLSAAPGSHFFLVSNDEEKRISFLLWPSHRGLRISSDGIRLTTLGFVTPPRIISCGQEDVMLCLPGSESHAFLKESTEGVISVRIPRTEGGQGVPPNNIKLLSPEEWDWMLGGQKQLGTISPSIHSTFSGHDSSWGIYSQEQNSSASKGLMKFCKALIYAPHMEVRILMTSSRSQFKPV